MNHSVSAQRRHLATMPEWKGHATKKRESAPMEDREAKLIGAKSTNVGVTGMKVMEAVGISQFAKSKRARAVVFRGKLKKTQYDLTVIKLVKNKREDPLILMGAWSAMRVMMGKRVMEAVGTSQFAKGKRASAVVF